MKLPAWLIKRTPKLENIRKIRPLLGGVHTVCEEAKCPNIGECFSKGTVTFMILGDVCTRNCGFCGVAKGRPSPVDPDEPRKVAEASKKLGLKYVVITSVTRDDLSDGGASQFAATINELRTLALRSLGERGPNSELRIEVLIPDFGGSVESLKTVIDAKPDVLNHNVEMVPRLYGNIRPASNFERSIELLKNVKLIDPSMTTKSGFMLGLGETDKEVKSLLAELRSCGCDVVTIGQYLTPSQANIKVVEYVRPEKFDEYRDLGLSLGINKVFSGPFVRSSYKAGEY